jgi:hypothetical protein
MEDRLKHSGTTDYKPGPLALLTGSPPRAPRYNDYLGAVKARPPMFLGTRLMTSSGLNAGARLLSMVL